jgi:hypothetical protein
VDVRAGKQQFHRLKEEIPELSRQARTAFATACATRTSPILFNHFGKREPFEAALDLCWRFAAGETLEASLTKAAFDECKAKVDLLYQDDERGCTLCALNSVMFALRSTYEPQAENAFDAALQSRDAARGDASDSGDRDAHLVEEADWQMEALDLIRKTTPPYAKTWFQEIDVEPKWLADYQEEWGD